MSVDDANAVALSTGGRGGVTLEDKKRDRGRLGLEGEGDGEGGETASC